MKQTFTTLFKKYKHAWVLLYGFIYMPWFCYLEKTVTITSKFNVLYSPLDDYIPFVEFFIIPYMLWFAYIAVTALYFFFCDKKGYYQLAAFLITGMTIFLVISTLWPNGQLLRPTEFARDNIFVDMVKTLYQTDTPTNVLPSIHVFNSIGAYIAISHSETLGQNNKIRYGAFVLTVLIILSTMFLKQHSIIDVSVGCGLAFVLYQLVYATERKKSPKLSRQPI